jgi:hypothetical protein
MPKTPPLDLIQIASPCHAAWDEMRGDERVRLCGHCQRHVYNLSEMSRDEAQAFLAAREGRTCLRLFRREDGTVLTRDCPVGVRRLRERLARSVAAIAGIFVALLSGTLLGGALSRLSHGALKAPAQAFGEWIDPPQRIHVLMGEFCQPVVPLVTPTGAEPAETPLPQPTSEQLQAIQQRLEQ